METHNERLFGLYHRSLEHKRREVRVEVGKLHTALSVEDKKLHDTQRSFQEVKGRLKEAIHLPLLERRGLAQNAQTTLIKIKGKIGGIQEKRGELLTKLQSLSMRDQRLEKQATKVENLSRQFQSVKNHRSEEREGEEIIELSFCKEKEIFSENNTERDALFPSFEAPTMSPFRVSSDQLPSATCHQNVGSAHQPTSKSHREGVALQHHTPDKEYSDKLIQDVVADSRGVQLTYRTSVGESIRVNAVHQSEALALDIHGKKGDLLGTLRNKKNALTQSIRANGFSVKSLDITEEE